MRGVLRIAIGVLALHATQARPAETIGDKSYTYVGTGDYHFASVSTEPKAMLDGFTFARKHDVRSTAYNQDIALDVVAAVADYGGVLIYVGHGFVGQVAIATYEYTANGWNMANARALALINGGSFAQGELFIGTIPGGTFPCYTINLTSAGFANRTNGDNAIAVISTCSSGSTTGSWDARAECLYQSACVNAPTAQADMYSLFLGLTSNALTDFSKMLVSQAAVGTSLTVFRDGSTALFPWITSATPDPSVPWSLPPTQVTMSFGTDMTQVSKPFYVGGYGVAKTNGWSSSTTANASMYYGWQIGPVIVGVTSTHISSSKGIPLYGGEGEFYYTYNCTVDTYPPAASLNAFIPTLSQSGGVTIDVDLMSLRGSEALWIEGENGELVGDTIVVAGMIGHEFTVTDPGGTATSKYRLLEREYDGDIFTRASEGISVRRPVVQSEPDATGLLASLSAKVGPVETPSGGPVGIVICPDAFTATAQTYANFWTAAGRFVEVVPLSVSGSTATAIHTYISGRYDDGVRYVLLAGSADEHSWFDDATKWPDLPGTNDWRFWFDDYHTPGGFYDLVSQPARDLVPMWYIADTVYDNMSYWTPYYATDYLYRTDFPGLRIGRVPAYTDARFAAWVAKDIAYCQTGSVAVWTDDVGIWGQCHSWDGNSGPLMEAVIEDFSSHLPPSLTQHPLIDTAWSQSERQSFALAAWNGGRGTIYMLGTSSSPYKPIHFFSKADGWNVGQMTSNRYPLLVASSCGIGAHDMAIDPAYGDHFATEVLTGSSSRGTPFVIAPSRGTWDEGNRQMVERLNQHMNVTPALDVGTAFMLAQNDVVASGPSTAQQTAMSYQLLGDPMAPLPGKAVATAVNPPARSPTKLLQNFPNPFNPSTTFRYSLSGRNHVVLRVYNVAGQRVATVVDGVQLPGLHSVEWQPAGLASGVYFYRLEAGSYSATRKMVLLK